MTTSTPSQPHPQPNPHYVVGQTPGVHAMLSARTAQNSAAFLLPHIKPHHKILDIGCGPGSITLDFAGMVRPEEGGECVGLDVSKEAVERAREEAVRRGFPVDGGGVRFVVGDGGRLAFDDNTFDIVYSHQILLHSPNPTSIIREIRRVLKPGGKYGSREAILSAYKQTPEMSICQKAFELLGQTVRLNRGHPEAGEMNQEWAVEAGFDREKMVKSYSWLGFGGRMQDTWGVGSESGIAKSMLEAGVVTEEEMREIVEAWKEFDKVEVEGKELVIKCGEVVCVK